MPRSSKRKRGPPMLPSPCYGAQQMMYPPMAAAPQRSHTHDMFHSMPHTFFPANMPQICNMQPRYSGYSASYPNFTPSPHIYPLAQAHPAPLVYPPPQYYGPQQAHPAPYFYPLQLPGSNQQVSLTMPNNRFPQMPSISSAQRQPDSHSGVNTPKERSEVMSGVSSKQHSDAKSQVSETSSTKCAKKVEYQDDGIGCSAQLENKVKKSKNQGMDDEAVELCAGSFKNFGAIYLPDEHVATDFEEENHEELVQEGPKKRGRKRGSVAPSTPTKFRAKASACFSKVDGDEEVDAKVKVSDRHSKNADMFRDVDDKQELMTQKLLKAYDECQEDGDYKALKKLGLLPNGFKPMPPLKCDSGEWLKQKYGG